MTSNSSRHNHAMNDMRPWASIARRSGESCFYALLVSWMFFHVACGGNTTGSEETRPFLTIEHGQFEVNVIIQKEDDSSRPGDTLGSGSLSFDYSGDISGTYSASGPLIESQGEGAGVGAILTLIEDPDFGTSDEAFSMLALLPTSGGKADIFLLGSNSSALLDSLQAGFVYGIGPFAPFNGLFLNGLSIEEFWAGEANFLETADNAFVLEAGELIVVTRDSTRITGTFRGTTHIN